MVASILAGGNRNGVPLRHRIVNSLTWDTACDRRDCLFLMSKASLSVLPRQTPLSQPAPFSSVLRLFVRDLVLPASIGVYDHEKQQKQRVRFNVTLESSAIGEDHGDRIDNVISYETIVHAIQDLLTEGHFELVETLADRICAFCLEDERVSMVQVRVEKLDIIADAAAVGVERQKWRHKSHSPREF